MTGRNQDKEREGKRSTKLADSRRSTEVFETSQLLLAVH